MLAYTHPARGAHYRQCVGWAVYCTQGVWRCLVKDKRISSHALFLYNHLYGMCEVKKNQLCYPANAHLVISKWCNITTNGVYYLCVLIKITHYSMKLSVTSNSPAGRLPLICYLLNLHRYSLQRYLSVRCMQLRLKCRY